MNALVDGTDAALQQAAFQLGERLKSEHLTLCTAESCTGGWIAKILTDVSGSSAWFDCGMAAYSYEAKQVWIAWKRRGHYPKAEVFHFSGDREAVRRQTVAVALRGLMDLL